MKYLRVAVLLTAYNRREMTLASLQSIQGQRAVNDFSRKIFLVDDGSTDGTAEAVAEQFPAVRILKGDGSLFWNGGMRMAFAAAMQEGFDAYLWVNDDCRFYPDAIERLLACAEQAGAEGGPAIVAGSMKDPHTGVHSYGGLKKRGEGLHLHFDAVIPDESVALPCDTMNGNLTLIPHAVARAMGNLDVAFRHQLGDWDYGLRATRAGYRAVVAPGYYGECKDNDRSGTWRDSQSTLRQRWAHLMSPKGAPPREWLLYTWRHFGWRWPFYAVSPYLRTLLR